VPAACFEQFDFAALGHLHRAQLLDSGRCAYAGSLLKYSFSEIGQEKGVSLVEIDARGSCTVERIPLRPRRDLRRIEGRLDDILNERIDLGERDDYVVVSLLDRTPLLDAMARLQRLLPNVLHLERPALQAAASPVLARGETQGLNPEDLFAAFFAEVTGEEMTREQVRLLHDVLEDLSAGEREVVPGRPPAEPACLPAPAQADTPPASASEDEDAARGGTEPDEVASSRHAAAQDEAEADEVAFVPPGAAGRLFDPDRQAGGSGQ
jgi:hypothetical protein